MNLLNMRYFIEAAETLNFTKAANNLNISQQALSTHIAALERELDAELFIRSVPVTLTQGGLLFKKYAQRFLDEYSSMIHEMNDIKDERRGALSIGIAHTRGRILLPRILPHFQRAFPKVDIKITEGRNDEMQKSLSEGKLELLICKLPVIGANVRSEFFYQEKAVLMVSDALLEKYFGAEKDAVAKEIERTADIGPLEKLPFMLPHRGLFRLHQLSGRFSYNTAKYARGCILYGLLLSERKISILRREGIYPDREGEHPSLKAWRPS